MLLQDAGPQKTADQTPLLHDAEPAVVCESPTPELEHAGELEDANPIPANITNRLYISHFLSTWNSRVFEFGAVLYLATIYPGTLLPLSIYALSRGLAAIIFAPVVGHYIDVGNRLSVVRFSIVLQRLAVAASCVIFHLLSIRSPMTSTAGTFLLVTLALLACIEKLCAVMNFVSVEKDWVVVVAGENHQGLKDMNAKMRRIDLICKLVGPLFIGLMDGISTETAILINLGMNVCSVIIEYYSIARVYYEVPDLRHKQVTAREQHSGIEADTHGIMNSAHSFCHNLIQKLTGGFAAYFRHSVFLPSFAGTLLYLTVLSFSGQMITWLLSASYDSTLIAITRTFSVVFEVLATWIAPWLMGRIGTTRAGLWLATWQISCLVAGTTIFWRFPEVPLISAWGLVGGTILSRIGLRGFDLCSQIIVQEGVESNARGSFSSTEAAWQNFFEILSYLSTIIFSRPEQFKWPVLVSVVAVCLAGALYASFVRLRRGHLVHIPKCFPQDRVKRPSDRVLERIVSYSNF